MSFESKLLGGVFNLDNFLKYKFCNELNYPSVEREIDVVFSDKEPSVCKADLFYNRNSNEYEKYPVLVNIHGGGWIIGDKKNSTGFCLQFADAGIFVMNINYGLPPKYLFPHQMQTSMLAFKWLEKNAEKYNLDLDNVFVSGDSAGSHMTSLVGAIQSSEEYAKALGVEQSDIDIKGYMMFCGIYDVDFYHYMPIGRSMMQEFVGMKNPRESKYYRYLNPMPFINDKMNNALIVSGLTDIMTITQSDKLAKALSEAGVNYYHYKNKHILNSFHDFMLLAPTKNARDCINFSIDWLKKTVAKG
ncbi:MAG: alpha/beta hydrolase [Clostridia bacterium]|nr:alpha/beta hydrolase [Clostridia bacterium]